MMKFEARKLRKNRSGTKILSPPNSILIQDFLVSEGERNLSELEFVRIRFLPLFEEIGICQNQNLSELEFVRIGICQNWNLSESEFVRIGICQNFNFCQNWNLSESEFVRIGICQSN